MRSRQRPVCCTLSRCALVATAPYGPRPPLRGRCSRRPSCGSLYQPASPEVLALARCRCNCAVRLHLGQQATLISREGALFVVCLVVYKPTL